MLSRYRWGDAVDPVVCAIASSPVGEPAGGRALLEQALTRAGLWERLSGTCEQTRADPRRLRVLVLAELRCFGPGAGAGTDPALVEQLIDVLGERGYEHVTVGMTLAGEDAWLDGRDLARTAAVAGYRGITDDHRLYEIADLAEDVVPVDFPEASALHGSGLSRHWAQADFRITFAKNRTDEEHGFALCLHNLLSALPLRDKRYHYRGRLRPWDVCVDLLRATPPHFAVIDAVLSCHGPWGSRAPQPLRTATIVASPDTLLTDWVGALKMGADPHLSALNARALEEVGLPPAYDIIGDLRPYDAWRNVPPALLAGVRRVNDSVLLGRVLEPLTTRVETTAFPFRSAALERSNRVVSSLLAPGSAEPLAEAAAIWLHAGLAATAEAVDAWRTLFAKDQLPWRDVPVDLDLAAYGLADYEAVDAYVAPLEQLIHATPGDHSGLRWRYLDGSVLFEFSRVLPFRFDRFCERVDISRAIEYMQDYIGGRRVQVACDARGRVTHQAERNVYLPQPNYIALYGGTVIDVSKLEHIHYGEHEQRIRWRTMKSANGSAEYDDGSVRFTDVDGDYTEITVAGRQKFTLPLYWQAVDLDLAPAIKDVLVGDAYFTFFDGTMTNFEAAYEGREFRVGRQWDAGDGERAPLAGGARAALDVGALAQRGGDLLRRLQAAASGGAGREGTIDDAGFRHFAADGSALARRGPGPVERFVRDLGAAVSRDLGMTPSADDGER
jgi:uncharacterized protein (DUF362 family)